MRVKILGSAAGGAFPQWNCACPNCRALRAGTFPGKARSQTQVAISAGTENNEAENNEARNNETQNDEANSWFLLGASPDLRAQIEATPELHPRFKSGEKSIRHSPIAGAVLANADVDHVLGLLLMRELQPLRVHAAESIRRIVTEDNSMFAMLRRVSHQVTWTDFVTGATFPLVDDDEQDSGIRVRALSLGAHFPAYVSQKRQSELNPAESSLGFIIEFSTGKRLAYMPAVPQIDDVVLKELEASNLVLFDGTFWSDDELIRIQGSGQTALQMGHVPVTESLRKLAQLRRPRKIYIHINNTNPMLDESGPEYRQVLDAGWEIAEDGCQFEM